SSVPEVGDNAIKKAAMELAKINSNPIWEFINSKLSDDNGKAFSLDVEDFVNGNIANKTTIAPTIIQETDTEILMTLNLRLAKEDSLGKFLSVIEKENIKHEVLEYMAPIYTDPETPFIQTIKEVYEDNWGEKAEFDLAYGTSYAKAMPNFVSYGPVFPGTDDTAHQANEYIMEKDFFLAMKIYLEAILKLAL
ncbi:MAG: M20/M25/M40 family metallo-hydrolase, partial [Anaerovoracaceae bacterium]